MNTPAIMAAYPFTAWFFERGKPVILGGGATRGDCDRMLRYASGPGAIAKGGVVVSIKSGTSKSEAAMFYRAVAADWRARDGATVLDLASDVESYIPQIAGLAADVCTAARRSP